MNDAHRRHGTASRTARSIANVAVDGRARDILAGVVARTRSARGRARQRADDGAAEIAGAAGDEDFTWSSDEQLPAGSHEFRSGRARATSSAPRYQLRAPAIAESFSSRFSAAARLTDKLLTDVQAAANRFRGLRVVRIARRRQRRQVLHVRPPQSRVSGASGRCCGGSGTTSGSSRSSSTAASALYIADPAR